MADEFVFDDSFLDDLKPVAPLVLDDHPDDSSTGDIEALLAREAEEVMPEKIEEVPKKRGRGRPPKVVDISPATEEHLPAKLPAGDGLLETIIGEMRLLRAEFKRTADILAQIAAQSDE